MPDSTRQQSAPERANIIIMHDMCIAAHGADCNRCVHACPQKAITLTDGNVHINTDACTLCGICIGICDAFASPKITLADLHARIRRIAVADETAIITCGLNVSDGFEPAHNVVVLPCMSMLSPDFWTLLLAEGVNVALFWDPDRCTGCKRAGRMGAALFPRSIQLAEERTGRTVGISETLPKQRSYVQKYSSDDELGRRQIFTGLLGDAAEIASGRYRIKHSPVIQDFYQRRERMHATAQLDIGDGLAFSDFAPLGRVKRTLFPSRRLLLEAIERMPEVAENIAIALSRTDYDVCTQRYDCMKACPTGARCPNEEGTIEVDARFCIGCGLCVEACKSGACELYECDARELSGDSPLRDDR